MKTLLPSLLLTLALALPGAASSQELLVYGGEQLNVFLGVLDAHPRDEESVWSRHGKYGSGTFNDTAIWSSFSKYGGRFGDYSPFNRNARFPPALFDCDGKFLGYLTVNERFPKRTRVRVGLVVLAYWETIRQDVPAFYDLYFDADDSYERSRGGAWGKPGRRDRFSQRK